jgi:hypothetical protein
MGDDIPKEAPAFQRPVAVTKDMAVDWIGVEIWCFCAMLVLRSVQSLCRVVQTEVKIGYSEEVEYE